MKALKYAIVSTVLAFGIAAPIASAQDAQAPAATQTKQHKAGRENPLLKGITLTADQQTKVNAIQADTQKKMKALSDADKKTQGRGIRENEGKQIRAVLTADQQKTYDANIAALKQHGSKGGDKATKKAPTADSAAE